MKQLYEPLEGHEIEAMSHLDVKARLELCEHQLRNKEHALEFIDAKPYMLAELTGLRKNISRLQASLTKTQAAKTP